MYDWLGDALTRRAEVITANRRLARILVTEFGQQQVAAGRLAWVSPSIFSLQDWLGRLASGDMQPESLPTRINAHQSKVLWERCLRRELTNPLSNVTLLVRQARDAWGRVRDFDVTLTECRESARGNDQHLFARAAESYQSILERERWIDDASLAAFVADLISQGRIPVPPRIILAGFDRVVPQVTRVLDALESKGTSVEFAPVAKTSAAGRLHAFESPDAELRAAGAWARRALEVDPALRIAIVVTNLERDAARSTRLVREGLAPGWQYGGSQYDHAVNVSYGRPLTAYPACDIALLLLRWLFEELTSREVSLLLRTPMLGESEAGGRTRFEMDLRRIPDRAWTPNMLVQELSDTVPSGDAKDWLERLSRLALLRSNLPPRDVPSAWAATFDKTLAFFNWPGVGTLSSAEFQLVNRWRELLNDLARLELVSPTMTVAEASNRLTAMAGETVFQPQAEGGLVQLMGPLEAAGMHFDRIWISGLGTANWPPAARPLALVARSLQVAHRMPDADPADTLDYAQRVLARLTSSAPDFVCSYSRTDGDAEQEASALLSGYEFGGTREATDPGWHARHLVASAAVATVLSDPVPPVHKDEKVSGGAAILQRQIEEPFAAFAQGRLGIRLLQPIVHGLGPGIRGSLIHDSLYELYRELPAQGDLHRWGESELTSRIDAAVDEGFGAISKNSDRILDALLELEKQRTARLLRAVVELDRERAPFSVAGVEQTRAVTIENVSLRVRIDRLDRLDSGEIVILDYKTGAAKKFLGKDDLPNDVQLVVYCFAVGERVSDLGLVNIDSRLVKVDGAGQTLTPDLDWDNALSLWRRVVEKAASGFSRGDVRIYGAHSLQTARPLALLSRIGEFRRDR